MAPQLSAAALLSACLAVHFHCSSPVSAKAFPETGAFPQPAPATVVAATAKPPTPPPADPVPPTASPPAGHNTPPMAAATPRSEHAPDPAPAQPAVPGACTNQDDPTGAPAAPEAPAGPSSAPHTWPSPTGHSVLAEASSRTAPQPAQTGIYQVLNGSRPCIKAEMGLQLVPQEKEAVFSPLKYFNINPNVTQASGSCGSRKSSLLLHFQDGFVNFTFTKNENSYYVSGVGARLTLSHPEKIYEGMRNAVVLFETTVGHSFKCVSEQSTELSTHLHLKTMNVQLQAFDFEGDSFGNAEECSRDSSRRQSPVAVGLSLAGLLGVLLTACLVARQKPRGGRGRP
ncbi:lysosome-associated membrane glycoprotein 3 isoform X2 [Tamandua tetradactyla]|uniref:lysosome-associated membrane glycoprotein 3 isoform X2 n=1 Tax=Tamandua tetradactyla TaxID=48850 RepID=UPI004054467D